MATKLFCDVCEKEIKGARWWLTYGRAGDDSTEKAIDLCPGCKEKVRRGLASLKKK